MLAVRVAVYSAILSDLPLWRAESPPEGMSTGTPSPRGTWPRVRCWAEEEWRTEVRPVLGDVRPCPGAAEEQGPDISSFLLSCNPLQPSL